VDLKDIKAIVDLMKKNAISEFEMEKNDFKIKLKRGLSGNTSSTEDSPYLLAPPVSQVLAQPATPAPSAQQDAKGSTATVSSKLPAETEIVSPMIGTFYASPSPDSPLYAEVGTRVNPESVVCIVEAMKVMNEIKAEKSGIITEILIENAKPVEFGQALFKVKPN
jgi:acetyl-CoA carboxylase biotin carboxyl carrier protein